jgi:signal transduction histidine kinase
MFRSIRRRLGIKLFFSYVVVILVGVLVLSTTAQLVIPSSFERHMVGMSGTMGHNSGMQQNMYSNFQAAVMEALAWATMAATAAAIIASWFVSRQVVTPVKQMMVASQRIAEGHYDERVQVAENIKLDEQDELAQLAYRFNQMAARLDQTETMRRQLIGDVAHELRTPLTIIKGTMEGLMDGVLPAEKETYQQVHQEADRLQGLVADLQELSRVESGSVPLQLKRIPVDRLVSAVTGRMGQLFADKGVQLRPDLPAHLPALLCDEDRLTQVLVNIVGNALKYTPEGGLVQISAAGRNHMVVLAVRDSGVGIASEHLPHIFTRFYRVDKSRSRASGGSGIGLAIAKSIVEAHGGQIWVESEGDGKGSSFFFTIPAAI